MKLLKKIIEPSIEIIFKNYNLEYNEYKHLIQIPRDTDVCDLCIPCFSLSKILKKSPIQIAEEIALNAKEIIKEDISINSINGYVNFYSDPKWLINKIIFEKYDFFKNNSKSNILIEHTSANPNGPFHVGRARNAILGDALVRLNRDYGNIVQAEYYVDDMGKQVGILAWAIENLTKQDIEKALKKEGIDNLNPMWENKEDHVRVRWYQAANILRKDNQNIESELSEMIKKSEEGDLEVLKQFNDAFQPILDGMLETLSKLGIKYDSFTNESQFITDGSVSKIMEQLKSSELYGVADNGAKYLELENKGVIKKVGKKIFIDRSTFQTAKATDTVRELCTVLNEFNKLLKKEKLINNIFEIDQMTDSIKKNFSFCLYQFNKFIFIYLDRWRTEVGDLETFSIGMIVLTNAMLNKKFSPSKIDLKTSTKEIMGTDPRGVNAMSISEITGIPRPTVVRKLKFLIDNKWLQKNEKKLISLNIKDNTLNKGQKMAEKNMLSFSHFVHRLFNQINIINS